MGFRSEVMEHAEKKFQELKRKKPVKEEKK